MPAGNDGGGHHGHGSRRLKVIYWAAVALAVFLVFEFLLGKLLIAAFPSLR